MRLQTTVPQDDVARLIDGTHWNPRAILGPHPVSDDGQSTMVIRAWLPYARKADVVPVAAGGLATPMTRVHEAGLFQAVIPSGTKPHLYRLRVKQDNGHVSETHDPYAFGPLLTDFQLHLFAEGTFYKAYETLGAHIRTVEQVTGVHFVVWAPNAARVSVVGDFNRWDGRCHPMTNRGATGLWELFIPDLPEGTLYKYEIRARDRESILVKADPYARAGELRPRTASVVRDLSRYRWKDDLWMTSRAQWDPLASPISIYEVHLGSGSGCRKKSAAG